MAEVLEKLPLCQICGTRHRGVNHDFRKKKAKPKRKAQ